MSESSLRTGSATRTLKHKCHYCQKSILLGDEYLRITSYENMDVLYLHAICNRMVVDTLYSEDLENGVDGGVIHIMFDEYDMKEERAEWEAYMSNVAVLPNGEHVRIARKLLSAKAFTV